LQSSILAKRAWLLLFLAIGAFYLWGLGSFPLVGPDEPRYAEVAREMLARSDVFTPTLGGLPWFEKPPLLYWMMMLSYRVLGVTEYAARLGPAICGLLTAVFVYWIGSAAHGSSSTDNQEGSGKWNALVWLTSLGCIGFSRGATFDIVLTMTITGAFAFFFAAQTRSNDAERFTLVYLAAGFYLFAGLSLLAKGLIGFVIIFGVIGFYFALTRQWPRRTLWLSLIWGVALALAVAGLWYGPMIARHGWTFIDQFIIQHHFARFATNKYHHPGPVYYYLPVLIGLALPWTAILVSSLIAARRWHWRGDSPRDRLRVFALMWLIVPVVFFSFSGSKLVAYILPALPAVAVLVGERIADFSREQRDKQIVRFTGALVLAIVLAASWYTHKASGVGFSMSILAAVPLVIVSILAMLQARAYVLVLLSIAALSTAGIGLKLAGPVVARTQSVRDLFTLAAARGYSTTPVVQLDTIERTAEFYAAGRLSYRQDGEPAKLEALSQVLEAARRNGGAVLCLIPTDLESQLMAARQADSELIGDNGRVALLMVRPK